MRRLWVVLLALLLLPATASAQDSRYSLAGGCFALATGGRRAGAEQVRLQATALGRYLLYRAGPHVPRRAGGRRVAPAPEPSPAADWRVEEAGGGAFTLAPLRRRRDADRVRFAPAEGCADYPEADAERHRHARARRRRRTAASAASSRATCTG